MKAVAMDALRAERTGDRQRTGDSGQAGVEGGIETGDLRPSGITPCGPIQKREGRGYVQRRERLRLLKFMDHRLIDPAMLQQARSAVNDAVPDRDRRTDTRHGQRCVDCREHRRPVRRIGLPRHHLAHVRASNVEGGELQ